MPKISYVSSAELLKRANIIYEFIDLFSNYENTPRSYSNDKNTLFSMIEIHTLVKIDERPGITSTELAAIMRRSKSFITQVLGRLEDSGCLIRVADENDAKKKHLYVTAEGKELCISHNRFDEEKLTKTYNYLLRDCTPQEIDDFYKVMGVYNNIMIAGAKKRKRK